VGNRQGLQEAHEIFQQRTVPVVVAAEELPAATLINNPSKQLSVVLFLRGSVPTDVCSNAEELRGKALARAIPKNTPVTPRDLSGSPVIILSEWGPPGTRAMSFRLSPEHAESIVPGSKIDVIVTTNDPDNAKKLVSKTILSNILVLARNPNGYTSGPMTVTVAVSPEEAEKLAMAKERGQLTPVLRRPRE
jgi:Flp pilus assembly protein CpaB